MPVAEVWGEILKFFGLILDVIFRAVPSYGIAIILLTIITRLIILPLGVKQIRSMQKMQVLQPKIKELQKKYKGDRQKLNEEMMKLYKEHGANPLGGCFPLIAQMPVFIALYAVIRAAIPIGAVPAADIAVSLKRDAICTPAIQGTTGAWAPSVGGPAPNAVTCDTTSGPQVFDIREWQRPKTEVVIEPPPYLARCAPHTEDGKITNFVCSSPLGTGHLPKEGKLFDRIVQDKAGFLGMHLACSPNQAGSATGIRQCTSGQQKASGVSLVMYYLLVVAMAGTTFIQQRQMLKKAPAQQAQQMKLMMTMMPVVFGFLSLQFPAALSLYWVTGNVWTIAQQKFILGREQVPAPTPPGPPGKKGKKGSGKKGSK